MKLMMHIIQYPNTERMLFGVISLLTSTMTII